MPTYEYHCQTCDRVTEVEMRITDPEARTCYTCGAPMERLVSRSSFQLKGGGWAKDLYSSSK